MSLSHQRRQGDGTVDGQTLDWAKRSDLYKMAKEFCVGKTLTPVVTSWDIPINENPNNTLDFGGLYFGKWTIQHQSQDVADNDNGRKRSQFELYNVDTVVARTQIIVHGDDILAFGSQSAEHLGFGTGMVLRKLEEDQQPQHGATVSFIGYKLTQQDGFVIPPPVVVVNPNNDGKVHLTVQDLTSLGYTYHWSEKDGKGTFINPNSPNAVFVPDGNGTYTLQLVVKDGTVPSTPVDVPVVIDFGSVSLENKGDVEMMIYTNGIGHVTYAPHQKRFAYALVGESGIHGGETNRPWWLFINRKLYDNGVLIEELDQYAQTGYFNLICGINPKSMEITWYEHPNHGRINLVYDSASPSWFFSSNGLEGRFDNASQIPPGETREILANSIWRGNHDESFSLYDGVTKLADSVFHSDDGRWYLEFNVSNQSDLRIKLTSGI